MKVRTPERPEGPPRYVPTLTEVVPEALLAAGVTQEAEIRSGQAAAPGHWSPDVLEEALVQRVMQRVDIGLDQRLRAAISAVVLEQTRSLLPRLREEVESVVRQVVCETVADEVAADAASRLRSS